MTTIPFRALCRAVPSILVLAVIAAPALALDPNSLKAVKSASSVQISWTDPPPPSIYCVLRGATAPPTTIIGSSNTTSFVDTPPAATLLFYGVDEPVSGVCSASSCAAAGAASCGTTFSGNNGAAGSTDLSDSYPSCGILDATGPEYAWSFRASEDLAVDLTLNTLIPGVDLFVLEDRGNGCDPLACVTSGDFAASFTATAGVDYFVVVDGRQSAIGDFAIDIVCSGGTCASSATLLCGQQVAGSNSGAGSASVVRDYAGCGVFNATGPERAYTFVATQTGPATFTLGGLAADLDIFVLEDQGMGCDPATCLALGDNGVTASLTAGRTYYVVVDGIAGATSSYTLDVSGCAPPPACEDGRAILCGGRALGSNFDPGGTDVIDSYPACSPLDESGPEFTYSFVAPATGDVTATLSGASAELDLFILSDAGGVCAASNCLAFGDNAVTFPAVAGTRYHVVVDGRSGASGSYLLNLDCVLPPGTCQPAASIACGGVNFHNNQGVGSTNANPAYPSCWPNNESGPEYTYLFQSPTRVTVRPTLDLTTADLDLFVLDGAAGSCNPANCLAAGDLTTTFEAQPGQVYYLTVDGRGGAVSDYRLLVECSPVPGACLATTPLACGATLTGNNGQAGSTDVIDQYDTPCVIVRPLDESGPEYGYRYVAAVSGNVTVDLLNPTAALHLYVLEERGNGCAAPDCVTFGATTVSFPAVAGTTYYILVEGFLGAVGDYDIRLTCG